MARKITLAVLQSSLTDDPAKNIKRVSELVREAASKGADVILPSELFEGHYFARRSPKKISCAHTHGNPIPASSRWRSSPANSAS